MMVEHDYLTAFEQEIEENQDRTHKLEGAQHKAMVELLAGSKELSDLHKSQYVQKPSPEKREQFQQLEPLLIYLAENNGTRLRIYHEETQIRLELKCLTIMGGTGSDRLYGEILSLLFHLYRDFSIEVVEERYVEMKFTISLLDSIQVADHSQELLELHTRLQEIATQSGITLD